MKLKNYNTKKNTATIKISSRELDNIIMLVNESNDEQCKEEMRGFSVLKDFLEHVKKM